MTMETNKLVMRRYVEFIDTASEPILATMVVNSSPAPAT
jgi:hypothetical protein